MSLPDLPELLALRATAKGLSLEARRAARSVALGAHHSAQRGRGLEFQEVRQYVAGDDPRTIDWRVTARRGRPHTKVFREERERPVWLLVDLNPGLYFGTRRQLKSAVVVRAAALLAWVAALGGDRVGAVVAGAAEMRILPPRGREAGVLPLLGMLFDLQPRAPAPPAPRALERALQQLLPLARPGSLVLVFSDFAELGASARDAWSALAAHTSCRLYWVCDPLEERGLPDGRFRAGLPEQLRRLDGMRVREPWRELWRRRTAQIETLSERIAAPVTRLTTSEAVEQRLGAELERAGARA
ncbi:MAG TPA: DUF58 domain-containing protein [Steroidobacteraceae bacterium]|nr:DUF58 domain-containing protein [Steroidobacteraceae bacterium]